MAQYKPVPGWQPHPTQEPLLGATDQVYGQMPDRVNTMLEHLSGLALLWAELATEVHRWTSQLPSDYPVDPQVADYGVNLAAAYQGMYQFFIAAHNAYTAANPNDVQRATQPRYNEQWNNVPAHGPRGIDLGPARRAFAEAQLNVWRYRPQNPPDLRAFLRGLNPTFWHVSRACNEVVKRGIAQFPGAGDGLVELWWSQAATMRTACGHAVSTAEAYEATAADELRRFDDPRRNEHLTNV